MEFIVKVLSVEKITPDVLRIVTGKPGGLAFIPGQATEISLDKEGWKTERRPFTFTSLPAGNYLEFTIKTYPEHKGVTNELLQLRTGDTLILNDVFGDISYRGEGVFIAGGAGVTPFISIFRDLKSQNRIGNNKLIFANKTRADIINETEFRDMLGGNFISILSDEQVDGLAHGYISEPFLKPYFSGLNRYVYLCGPPPMMDAVEKCLRSLQVPEDRIVKEGF